MKIAGIICEYNPFHNGHEYLIREAHKKADAVVCVMSGHFVQRGEVAFMDKYTRAKVAVQRGADLVLELPFPYCMASASFFAGAGISILDGIGTEELYFGSEIGDAEKLKEEAHKLIAEKREDPGHEGSAKSYFADIERSVGPNDILGMQYILEIEKAKSPMIPHPVKRAGDGYHEKEIVSDRYASATALRNYLMTDDSACENYISREMKEAFWKNQKQGLAPARLENLEQAILGFWRLSDPESLATQGVAGLGNGLAYRLCECAMNSQSLSEFLAMAATKKYTDAFLRRVTLGGMLQVLWSDLDAPVAYTCLLGANKAGRDVMAEMRRKKPSVSIVTKNADIKTLAENNPEKREAIRRQFALAQRADSLFSLALPKNVSTSFWMKKHAFIDRGVDLL